jgi:hypothetical protein
VPTVATKIETTQTPMSTVPHVTTVSSIKQDPVVSTPSQEKNEAKDEANKVINENATLLNTNTNNNNNTHIPSLNENKLESNNSKKIGIF